MRTKISCKDGFTTEKLVTEGSRPPARGAPAGDRNLAPYATLAIAPGRESFLRREDPGRRQSVPAETRMVSLPYWFWIEVSVPSSTFFPLKIMKM